MHVCVCVGGGHWTYTVVGCSRASQSLLGTANIREWVSSYTLVSYPGLHTKDESHTDIFPL